MIQYEACHLKDHCTDAMHFHPHLCNERHPCCDRDERRLNRNWEPVTDIQDALQRPIWEKLIEKRTAKFMLSVAQCAILNG